MTGLQIRMGTGVYYRAEAAHLLHLTASRLGRWVSGYTYWLRYQAQPSRRRQPPVVKTDLPQLDGAVALSFLELMELRVVKAFIDKGVSLQRVRKAAHLASQHFGTEHPFASRRVFTDGHSIFASLSAHEDDLRLIELASDRHLQILFGEVLEPFLNEIDFDQTTALAHRWWPLGRRRPVVLDPRIAFGAPTVAGTRVRTDTVFSTAQYSDPAAAAEAYRLTGEQVQAAVEFESMLAAA